MEIATKQTTTKHQTTAIHPEATNRIYFEDRGQDFQFIDIDSDGAIVDCNPNHRPIWIGRFIDIETICEGKYPEYIDARVGRDSINYRVRKVEQVNRED